MTTAPTRDALIVVDVQNDFCPRGALAVKDGDRIVPLINALSPRFAHRVFTRDWHPANHCSFSEAPRFADKSWPPHCIASSHGSAFHVRLSVPNDAILVEKGTDPGAEAYSGFQGTNLAAALRERGVDRVFICGLATDYCVKHTAIDALRGGFRVAVLEDACRAVDVPPGSGAAAFAELGNAGAAIVRTESVLP